MSRIKFKKLYQPVRFGDEFNSGSVEGRRKAALNAAETKRFLRMVEERQEAEKRDNGTLERVLRFVG